MSFEGFPKAGTKFLKDLTKNNNREWFQENKTVYKSALEEPAKAFLDEMCDALGELTGNMMDGKVYRFYRDVRFSKDKTPYNTYIRMSFYEVVGNKACGERPAFHFSLEATEVLIGLGFFEFSKELLARYQAAIDDDTSGKALTKALTALTKQGFMLDGEEYKRVPRPYDPEHPRADLLRRKGLTIWSYALKPSDLSDTKAVNTCLKQYKTMMPVFQWLENLG